MARHLLMLSLLLLAAAPAAAQPLQPDDVASVVKHPDGSLEASSLRLTEIKVSEWQLTGRRVLHVGRVTWTAEAGAEGQPANLPVTFAVVDTTAQQIRPVATVRTNAEGHFRAVLPIGEYVLMVRTQQAEHIPAEARRLLVQRLRD